MQFPNDYSTGRSTALEEDSGYYSSQVVSEPKYFTGLPKQKTKNNKKTN